MAGPLSCPDFPFRDALEILGCVNPSVVRLEPHHHVNVPRFPRRGGREALGDGAEGTDQGDLPALMQGLSDGGKVILREQVDSITLNTLFSLTPDIGPEMG